MCVGGGMCKLGASMVCVCGVCMCLLCELGVCVWRGEMWCAGVHFVSLVQ